VSLHGLLPDGCTYFTKPEAVPVCLVSVTNKVLFPFVTGVLNIVLRSLAVRQYAKVERSVIAVCVVPVWNKTHMWKEFNSILQAIKTLRAKLKQNVIL
jgi:hypothetical protein